MMMIIINHSLRNNRKRPAFQEIEDDYPDPSTLPLPSQEPRIAEVTLSDLEPGKYVSTTARIVYLRAIEKQDDLGSKMVFSGILEDSSFKVPFVSHRISFPLIRNCVYRFQSAYVHEFVEYKKSTIKARMDKIVDSLLNEPSRIY
jgi:hypothetical protein